MRERENHKVLKVMTHETETNKEMGAMIVWIRTRICWWRPERPSEN